MESYEDLLKKIEQLELENNENKEKQRMLQNKVQGIAFLYFFLLCSQIWT